MADGVVIYRSYINAMNKLPDRLHLPFLLWLIDYGIDGKLPDFSSESSEMQFALDLLFGQIKATIDSGQNRYSAAVSNGKKGGRPRGSKTRKKPDENQSKTRPKPDGNLNEKDKENDKEKDNSLYSLNKECVSDGSPLKAEPPSTQSTEKRYNALGQELDEYGFVKRE